MRRSISDIRVLHMCGTRGRIQGRSPGSLGQYVRLDVEGIHRYMRHSDVYDEIVVTLSST